MKYQNKVNFLTAMLLLLTAIYLIGGLVLLAISFLYFCVVSVAYFIMLAFIISKTIQIEYDGKAEMLETNRNEILEYLESGKFEERLKNISNPYLMEQLHNLIVK